MRVVRNKKIIMSCFGLMLGLIITILPASAAEPSVCTHTFLIYDHTDTVISSYDHQYAYGTCHVTVTEKYDVYKCNCGFYFSRHLASRVESHSQPH